jgi:hypothetical protein
MNGICYVTDTSKSEKNAEKLMPTVKDSGKWKYLTFQRYSLKQSGKIFKIVINNPKLH